VVLVWVGLMIVGGLVAGNPGGFEGNMTALFINVPLGIWEFRRWRARRRSRREKVKQNEGAPNGDRY